MSFRRRCLSARSLQQFTPQRQLSRQRTEFRDYSASVRNSARPVSKRPESIPLPKTLEILQSREHRFRRGILFGLLAATVTSYYLDGKYNARAIRRTLRTAWVGATLAADYKWNFTLATPCIELIEGLKKPIKSRNCTNEWRDG